MFLRKLTGRPLSRTISDHPVLFLILLLLLSLPARLLHLEAPLAGEHEFRQTQTAMSVWEIREYGFSLLHPTLSLFGPPWECPFEYPVFQTVAAAVDGVALWENLDCSVRVTNLAFFYLSALALYLLARLLFPETSTALFAAAVFLFSPFNLSWSRNPLIEYAATFFSLVYLPERPDNEAANRFLVKARRNAARPSAVGV